MVTRLQKWGNSQGLRFPREILEKAAISVGEEVDVSVRGGEIIVKPAMRIRGKYRLKDLVAKIPTGYKPFEVHWGKPAGKEIRSIGA
jgi:antitoxin MazE